MTGYYDEVVVFGQGEEGEPGETTLMPHGEHDIFVARYGELRETSLISAGEEDIFVARYW